MRSSATASIATRSSVVSSMMATVSATDPVVTITLKGEETPDPKATKTFSNLDTIEGEVNIVAPVDTRFDEIYITLEGTIRTWLERFGASTAITGRSEASMTFLREVQPVEESALPIPRIAEKGKTYTFPFTFVVPERLLPTICTHRVSGPSVHEAHLQLPPSMGYQDAPYMDDVTPDMAKISYCIRVRVIRRRESDGKALTLQDTARKVRVIPAVEDQPPLHIESGDYALRKERDIRKGLFKGKLGRLTVEAEQPKPLRLSLGSLFPPTTTVPLSLRFTPADDSFLPPKLGSLSTKLKISTFYATNPISTTPTKSAIYLDPSFAHYSESVLLSSRCVEGAKWNKNIPSSTSSPLSNPFYTAQILVPITAPKGKFLVPSFNSCLVSRHYSLDITLSVNASAHTAPSLSLNVPLQVSNPSNNELPAIEEYFTPRSIAPPEGTPLTSDMNSQSNSGSGSGSGSGTSSAEATAGQLPPHMIHRPNFPPPPGYSFFAPGNGGVARVLPVRIPSPVGISPGCG